MLDKIIEFIGKLDLPALYSLIGAVAFIEGVFPPLPADVVVAFAAFLAARQGADFTWTLVAVTAGSTAGAAVIYGVARRFGSKWMRAKMKRFHVEGAEKRLEAMYARYGMGALFVSRFIPGFRAVGAPMAGMLKVPFLPAMGVVALASAIWYGLIAALAFRVGTDWEMLQFALRRLVRRAGLTALAAVILAAIIVWAIWRQRKERRASAETPPTGTPKVE